MAISKTLMAALLISQLILLNAVELHQQVERVEGGRRNVAEAPESIDCGAACARRCMLSSRQNLCKRACGACCARCGCVPPGTYGHQEVCPCYFNQTTHGGRPKCP